MQLKGQQIVSHAQSVMIYISSLRQLPETGFLSVTEISKITTRKRLDCASLQIDDKRLPSSHGQIKYNDGEDPKFPA